MKICTLLTVLILGTAGLYGTTPPRESQIQPRLLGAQWAYSSYYYDDGKRHWDGISTETVVEERTIEGQICYRVELIYDGRTFWQRFLRRAIDPEDISYIWEYYSEEGSFHYYEDCARPKPPKALSDFELSLPYPAAEGHRVEALGDIITVIEVDKKVKVPAGEFICMVYEFYTEDTENPEFSLRSRFYQAPGVGLVMWEEDERDEAGEWVLSYRDELVRYRIVREAGEVGQEE